MSKGFVEQIGLMETVTVAVANGETSKSVTFNGRNKADYKVFALANYASANIYVTAKTVNSFTLNFADPTADKEIDVLIIA